MNDIFQFPQISEKILNTVKLPAGTLELDLTQINKHLSERLNLTNIEITTKKTKWLTQEEVEKITNDDLYHLSFSLLPLEGDIHLLMPTSEISKITSWVMTKDETTKAFSSEILQEGFYHYLILEAMDAIDKNELLQEFSLKMHSDAKKLDDIALCMDICITYQTRSVYAKLIISPQIVKGWKKHFFIKPNYLASKISTSVSIPLSINIGSVDLSYEAFEQVSQGDFIVLDHSFYDPKTHQGNVLLTLDLEPLYQGKIKQNNITILDFAKFKEDYMEDTEKGTPLKDVSLTLQVEMGKIEMNLEQLVSLKPGEVIETTINPNDSVSLNLNNKKVAKGTLVKVGETIGVRILEIS